MEYFSDKEKGTIERKIDEISEDVHDGIIGIYEKFSRTNSFSHVAGEECPDSSSICGFDRQQFEKLARSEIPSLNLIYPKLNTQTSPFHDKAIKYKVYDKYKLLDFIQFCYKNLQKAETVGGYHDYFKHYHYKFKESEEVKESFRQDINTIFARNGIIFELDFGGEIKRIVPLGIEPLISKLYSTKDAELDALVKEAFERFLEPKFEDRRIALEKIWDAFERMKTYYIEKNKKESITQLIREVSLKHQYYEKLLTSEAKILSDIGNSFRIRHHETGKHEILDDNQIDYFFYRMVSFMALFLKNLESK